MRVSDKVCANCKWWIPNTMAIGTRVYGECGLSRVSKTGNPEHEGANIISRPDKRWDRSGAVRTRHDFGCNQWEGKVNAFIEDMREGKDES